MHQNASLYKILADAVKQRVDKKKINVRIEKAFVPFWLWIKILTHVVGY